jgi:hypothetical protein
MIPEPYSGYGGYSRTRIKGGPGMDSGLSAAIGGAFLAIILMKAGPVGFAAGIGYSFASLVPPGPRRTYDTHGRRDYYY